MYAQSVGVKGAEIAIVLGAQLVLAIVAKPVSGRLSDRMGRIPVIVIGLMLCAAALPLSFRSESLAAFILVAPVLGLGVGAAPPVTNAPLPALAPAWRPRCAIVPFGPI